jgi:hypothetical protein
MKNYFIALGFGVTKSQMFDQNLCSGWPKLRFWYSGERLQNVMGGHGCPYPICGKALRVNEKVDAKRGP